MRAFVPEHELLRRDGSGDRAAQHALGSHEAREVAHQVPRRALRRGGFRRALRRGVRARARSARRVASSCRRVVAHAGRRQGAGTGRAARAARAAPAGPRRRSGVGRRSATCAADQLRRLQRCCARTTSTRSAPSQDQNLVIRNVPQSRRRRRSSRGSTRSGSACRRPGDNVVACPGTRTCRLGITASQPHRRATRRHRGLDLRVRVSGCHNGCAQPETGDIGIYGEGRRMHDRLVPHYQLYLGGDGMAGGRLASQGPVGAGRAHRGRDRRASSRRSTRRARRSESVLRLGAPPGRRLFRDVARRPRRRSRRRTSTACCATSTAKPTSRSRSSAAANARARSQVFIGAAFFAAAHERRYRDAFARAAVATPTQWRARAATGAADRAGPQRPRQSRGVVPRAQGDRRSRRPRRRARGQGAGRGRGADRHASPRSLSADDRAERRRTTLFAESMRGCTRPRAFSVERDPQLDIAGALPRSAGRRRR